MPSGDVRFQANKFCEFAVRGAQVILLVGFGSSTECLCRRIEIGVFGLFPAAGSLRGREKCQRRDEANQQSKPKESSHAVILLVRNAASFAVRVDLERCFTWEAE